MSSASKTPDSMIPFADPRATFTRHRDALLAAMATVLDSGTYILGPEVERFEANFAATTGVAHAVGVGNGTDAIELALRALSVGPKDAVFTVSHTAVGTVAAIERAGAIPVLVDVNPHTRCMCPDSLAESLEHVRRQHPQLKPAAVIPVHLYGHPAPLDEIEAVCNGLPIIEDCAQAAGARYKGTSVGSRGQLAAWSFYPTKNLGGVGDGGCVCTSDGTLAERLRSLRQYGWQERYISAEPGVNTRLDPIQAAILSVLLPHLETSVAERRALAARYTAALGNTSLLLPKTAPWADHAFHLYVAHTQPAETSAQRDAFVAFMRQRNIGVSLHYPAPVHAQPAYALRIPSAQVILAPNGLPVTEALYRTLVTLPLYPGLHFDQQDAIIESILGWK